MNSGSSTKLNAILPDGAHFSGDYKKSGAKHWTGLEQFEGGRQVWTSSSFMIIWQSPFTACLQAPPFTLTHSLTHSLTHPHKNHRLAVELQPTIFDQ